MNYITVCYSVVCLRTDTKRHEQLFSSHMSQIATLRAGFSVKDPSDSLHNLHRVRVDVLPGPGGINPEPTAIVISFLVVS